MKKIFYILFFLFLLFPHSVIAAGVEASPSKLELRTSGSNVKAELSVRNPSADVQLFEVYPDEFGEDIKILPESFVLEAGSSKAVAISYVAKNGKEKIIKTNISVVARPLSESRFQFNSGIKIPITIIVDVKAQLIPWWIYAIAIALIILGALFIYIQKKKKQEPSEIVDC